MHFPRVLNLILQFVNKQHTRLLAVFHFIMRYTFDILKHSNILHFEELCG